MINLDYNATAPTLPEVQRAMLQCPQGNSNSWHQLGRAAKLAEQKAESILMDHLGNPGGRIIWTSSGSHANSLAIHGLCKTSTSLITSTIEHKSIDDIYWEYGFKIDLAFGIMAIKRYILNNAIRLPSVVSIMLVNNETGMENILPSMKTIYPYMIFHTDAVQALGKMDVNPDALNVDVMSFSAHKIGGPKGMGALWVRDGIDINVPYLGTPNTPGIVGFGKAIEELGSIDTRRSLLGANSEIFFQELIQNKTTVLWFGKGSPIVPGTMSLQFPGINGVELAMILESEGVIVSTGAACGSKDYSKVLIGSGLSKKQALSTIRVSLSVFHTETELKEAAKIVAKISKELKNGS